MYAIFSIHFWQQIVRPNHFISKFTIIHGDAIKISAAPRYCGLRSNCHVTHVTVVCSTECISSNVVSLSFYKCFFEPFSSAEVPSLVSLSWNVGKGKPLNENRGERWFHAD